MAYTIKNEDREASAKRLSEIKLEMLNLLNESDGILMDLYESETSKHKISKFWMKTIRDRITGDNVLSSLAFEIECLKDVE